MIAVNSDIKYINNVSVFEEKWEWFCVEEVAWADGLSDLEFEVDLW